MTADRALLTGGGFVTVLGLALVAGASGVPLVRRPPPIRALTAVRAAAADSDADVSSSEPARALTRNVFRAARRPPRMAFGAVDPTTVTDGSAERRSLRLVGLVVGERPMALIEGVPGVSGAAVLAPGDTLQALRVTRVGARSVNARWRGDTLTLQLRDSL